VTGGVVLDLQQCRTVDGEQVRTGESSALYPLTILPSAVVVDQRCSGDADPQDPCTVAPVPPDDLPTDDEAAVSAPVGDGVSLSWVQGLQSTGRPHDECVASLHALLLRVARHEASRRAGSLHLRGPELEDVAQQAADDALMAIKAKVGEFRGDSRFTT
jgi:hypothetical protein